MKKSSLLALVFVIILLSGCGTQRNAVTGASVDKVNTTAVEQNANKTEQQAPSTQPQKVNETGQKPTVTPKPAVTPKGVVTSVTTKPAVTPKPEVTIKKFLNSTYHYSFSYPSVFVLEPQSAEPTYPVVQTFYNSSKDAILITTFEGVNGGGPSFDSVINNEKQKHQTIISTDKQTNNNISYLTVTWQDGTIIGNDKFIQVGDDQRFTIEMQYPVSEKNVYQPYFDTVINSFNPHDWS